MTQPATSAPIAVVLAFDYGSRRIGVASGNTLSRSATPLCTLDCVAQQIPWPAIHTLLQDYAPAHLVVGLPLNDDGTPTQMTAPAQAFAAQLRERSGVAVSLVDEGHSSREAERELAALRRRGIKTRRVSHADVDKVAAKVVLERWFQQLG